MNPADDPYTTTLRGLIALLHENLDDAEQLAWLAVTTGRKTRHPDHLCRGLVLVGLVHSYRGDHEAAHRVLTEAMQSAGRVRLRTYQRYVLAPIAATWAMIEPVKGATLVSAVEANDGRDNRTLHYPIARAVEQATRFIESSLEPGTMAEARQRGAAMTLDEAIELALEPS